jgi:SAM-dependent methyltransferase
MLERARARLGPEAELVESSAEDLPFADGSFDVVACRVAAHHFADPAAAVREMARVSADRVLIVDNLYLDDRAEEADKLRDPSHVRNYTEAEWRAFCEAAGLRIEDVRVLDTPIAFEPFLERAGCTGEDAERVRELLAGRICEGWVTLDRIALRTRKAG